MELGRPLRLVSAPGQFRYVSPTRGNRKRFAHSGGARETDVLAWFRTFLNSLLNINPTIECLPINLAHHKLLGVCLLSADGQLRAFKQS